MYHKFDMGQGPFGSFETFEITEVRCACDDGTCITCQGEITKPGWYWWACFPGCLPDSHAAGPFATEADAVNDANAE